jgi:sugar/nucleoside kinase (ribokinase family)
VVGAKCFSTIYPRFASIDDDPGRDQPDFTRNLLSDKPFDVFGIGNALVDILAMVPHELLKKLDLAPGSMTLMDAEKQADILQHLEHEKLEMASGGSAANTMVGIAQSGGTGTYCGKVAKDTHGLFYQKDMSDAGIGFDVEMAPEAALPTGTSIILTTPDAERTMCTHLGISTSLTADDVDVDRLAQSKVAYIEGYLWDAETPREACVKAMQEANKLGVKTAFTFSDSFLVDRFPDDFKEVTKEYCDIAFCNSDEAKRFCESEDLEACVKQIGELVSLAFITDSANGCFVVKDKELKQVAGFPVEALDTVGAGDAFAGGVLYGLTNGLDEEQAARWGNYLASRIVQINGPRLASSVADEVAKVTG